MVLALLVLAHCGRASWRAGASMSRSSGRGGGCCGALAHPRSSQEARGGRSCGAAACGRCYCSYAGGCCGGLFGGGSEGHGFDGRNMVVATALASTPDTSTSAALLDAEGMGNLTVACTEAERWARSFSARRRDRTANASLLPPRRRSAACGSAARG